jgi:hypothetical protein
MSAIVYLGTEPSSSNVVSETLKLKGINLLKASPSEMHLFGDRVYTNFGYEKYIANLPTAVASARQGHPVHYENMASFHPLREAHQRAPFCRNPALVWSYSSPNETTDRVVAAVDGIPTTSGGKPAITGYLSSIQARQVIDSGASKDTPFSMNNVNLSGYAVYLKLHAIYHALARLHQYPLVVGGSANVVDGWARSFLIERSAIQDTNGKQEYPNSSICLTRCAKTMISRPSILLLWPRRSL